MASARLNLKLQDLSYDPVSRLYLESVGSRVVTTSLRRDESLHFWQEVRGVDLGWEIRRAQVRRSHHLGREGSKSGSEW